MTLKNYFTIHNGTKYNFRLSRLNQEMALSTTPFQFAITVTNFFATFFLIQKGERSPEPHFPVTRITWEKRRKNVMPHNGELWMHFFPSCQCLCPHFFCFQMMRPLCDEGIFLLSKRVKEGESIGVAVSEIGATEKAIFFFLLRQCSFACTWQVRGR